MQPNYENVDALGTAKFLIMGEKFKEARQALDLIRPYAKGVPQLNAIGQCYAEARAWQDMHDIAEQLYYMTEEPVRSSARASMIRALLSLNYPEEALKYIDEQNQHIKMHKDFCNNEMERAMALFMMNRKEDSYKILTSIRTTDADLNSRIQYNLATHIMRDDFKTGYSKWVNHGREFNSWAKAPLPEKNRWWGEKTDALVVIAEGGIGDEIINVRFMAGLSGLHILPYWYTDRKDLAEVFRANGFNAIDSLDGIGPDMKWTYSFDLPWLLKLDKQDLWKGPYLSGKTRRARSKKLPVAPGTENYLRVGVKCQGNDLYEQDLHRSVNRHLIIKSIPHISNVYAFDNEADDHDLKFMYGNRFHELQYDSWDDTLDYITEMDVVVTTCTSVAHASSAMGKPTCVLVPIMSYYPWVHPGNTSPWYGPDTVLFRQVEPRSWDQPLKELRTYLENIQAHSRA